MNDVQHHVDSYMKEVIEEFFGYNDFSMKEAWEQLKPYVMDALEGELGYEAGYDLGCYEATNSTGD